MTENPCSDQANTALRLRNAQVVVETVAGAGAKMLLRLIGEREVLATVEEQMRKALLVSAAVLMIAAGAPSMASDQPGAQKAHKDNPTQIHGDQPGAQKGHKDNPTQHPVGTQVLCRR